VVLSPHPEPNPTGLLTVASILLLERLGA